MTGIFKIENGQRIEMTQAEVDAFEASRAEPVLTLQEQAAAIGLLDKAAFCRGVRVVYEAGAQPLGPIVGPVDQWLLAIINALDDTPPDNVVSAAQKAEALDRWSAANRVEYANPLLPLIGAVLGFSGEDLANAFVQGKDLA
ncbi:MAG: hypothetical protein AAF661_05050 [Pseudomonadota bacterium]